MSPACLIICPTGSLGNDTSHNSPEKSLQKYLLPRTYRHPKPSYPYSKVLTIPSQKQTKNTYHRADPAFSYLLSLFLALTGLAWGLAYANGLSRTISVVVAFVILHFLATSLVVSTAMFFLVGRVLGKRRQGLFGPPVGGEEGLEFGYCFDVSGTVQERKHSMLM